MNVATLANAVPPLATKHAATWRLFRHEDLYCNDSQVQQLFVEAMRENVTWHYEKNPHYRKVCDSDGFEPGSLKAPADLVRLPTISSSILKETDLSTECTESVLTVTSSGTGGTRTSIRLDPETIIRMWVMGRQTFAEAGLISATPVHYIICAPAPDSATTHGNAVFFSAIMQFAPAKDITYALAVEAGALTLNRTLVQAKLAEAESDAVPVRVIGLPAVIADLAQSRAAALSEDSLVLTGGGWKNQAHRAISKQQFRDLVSKQWGVPTGGIRDLYGMTEHAVHYLDCAEHHFHAPCFSKVDIVDPLTFRSVPIGEEGVIRLMNPGFTTLPVPSLLTADIARRVSTCGCGRETMAFEVLGRAGADVTRGCAARTFEQLRS